MAICRFVAEASCVLFVHALLCERAFYKWESARAVKKVLFLFELYFWLFGDCWNRALENETVIDV
jgi:hypothetical protein